MYHYPTSALLQPQDECRRDTEKGERVSGGGGRIKLYKHALTDYQAAFLAETGNSFQLQEIKKKTGANVEIDLNRSPVPGMKIVTISGVPSQIEAAVSLISQITGGKGNLSEEAQTFWLQWVEAAFPNLSSQAYFLPPVYFNRVPMTRDSVAGQDVLVLRSTPRQVGKIKRLAESMGNLLTSSTSPKSLKQQNLTFKQSVMIPSSVSHTSIPQSPFVQDSDVRDDAAMQRVLFSLQSLSEKTQEVLVGLTHLRFGQYLGEPCFSVAAAHLPRRANLPPDLPQNWKQGDFDVLLIHRHYGFITCAVKAFGDNFKEINLPKKEMESNIRRKLKEAIAQLSKKEAMLSHLVSDIAPGLRITKIIAFPNLTTRQLQQAISEDFKLKEDLCRCLGTADPANIPGVCLCCDQLSDPKTPCDVSSHVLSELGHWWQRRVAGAGPDSLMTSDMYKILVARFCGPATTVSVPCTCPPRVSVKTLGQAVWWTGECYTAVITLFPEQVHLLHTAPPTLFVTGPPGTGKTVVLLLMAIQWLRCGHHVYVLSTWWGSRAACSMLYHLLLQTVKTQQSAGVSPGQPHLLLYELDDDEDVEKAVNDLSQAAIGGSLYVIADEAVPEYKEQKFQTFCKKLLARVPRLHLWAACYFHDYAPAGWQVEYLTRPLRSPPVVFREVEQDASITNGDVKPYRERGVPDHTDGPPVRRLYHRGQGHSGDWPGACVTCGREVASFLYSLRVGVTENVTAASTTETFTSRCTTPTCLQWRDVLVLYWRDDSDNTGMMTGLQEAGIPVRVMTDDDIEDVATARSDVVWVADERRVRGLERKVVVCVNDNVALSFRLHWISRCTSQLVIVSLGD